MKRVASGLVMVACAIGIAQAATAQVAQGDLDRLERIRACDALARKSERYACYDRANRPAPASAASRSPGHPDPSPRQSFGSESMTVDRHARAPRPDRVDQVEAHATAARDTGVGQWTIALDDGTRWQMLDSMRQFAPPRMGQPVRIQRAALGSFLLFAGHQPGVRVRRLD